MSENNYKNNEIKIELYRKKNFFNYPNVFNIDEEHKNEKIKKSFKSNYFILNKELRSDLNQDFNVVFDNLKNESWREIE